MIVEIFRTQFFENETLGEMYIDNKFFCYTLEDRVLKPGDPYTPGRMAIPAEEYEIQMDFSPHFNKIMPHVLNLKGRMVTFHGTNIDLCGIRIHGGNTNEDTLGCPLIAFHKVIGKSNPTLSKIKNWIFGSASVVFSAKCQDAITDRKEPIKLIIVETPTATVARPQLA